MMEKSAERSRYSCAAWVAIRTGFDKLLQIIQQALGNRSGQICYVVLYMSGSAGI